MRGIKKIPHFLHIFSLLLFTVLTYSSLFLFPRNYVLGEFYVWAYGNSVIKHNLSTYHQIGLWDVIGSMGYPLMVDINSLFYPFSLPSFIFSNTFLTLNLITLFHIILGALAFYYLLRILKCNSFAATIGSCLYVGNYYVTYVLMRGWLGEIYNLVWMPLTIAFLWKALFEKKYEYAFLAGICFSMEFLSMSVYPIFFVNIIVLFLFVFAWLYRLFISKLPLLNTSLQVGLTAIITYGITIGLSAVKLFPIIEFKSLSMRDKLPLYGLPQEIIHLSALPQYILLVPPTAPKLLFIITNLFFIAGILLSFIKRSKETVFFSVLTFISIWAALGNTVGIDIYQLFYRFIPGINTIQYIFRFFIITHLGLPVLFALGTTYFYELLVKKSLKKIHTTFVVLSVFCLFLVILFCKYYIASIVVQNSITTVFVQNETNVANKLLHDLTRKDTDMYRIATFYSPAGKEVSPLSALFYDYKLTNLADAVFSTTYQYVPFDKLQTDKDTLYKKYKLLGLMNTKYAIAENPLIEKQNPYLESIKSFTNGIDYNDPFKRKNEGHIFRLTTFLPYVLNTPHTILLLGDNTFNDFNAFPAKVIALSPDVDLKTTSVVTGKKKASEYSLNELEKFNGIIITGKDDISQSVKKTLTKKGVILITVTFHEKHFEDIRERSASIISNSPALSLSKNDGEKMKTFLSSINNQAKSEPTNIHIQSLTPEKTVLSLKTTASHTFIAVADSYYPGWEVFDNGKKITLFMADGMAKGFFVDKSGNHTVELVFRPSSFYIGGVLTLATLIILMTYGFVFFRNRRK